MRLFDINGKLKNKNVSNFLIKWDAKSRSNIQFTTKQFLKKYWFGYVVYEEFPVFGTRLKVDIVNASQKIAIEVNGFQHESFNKFFHDNSRANYLKSIKRDLTKIKWLEMNKFKVIEINEDEIKLLSKEFFLEKFNVLL